MILILIFKSLFCSDFDFQNHQFGWVILTISAYKNFYYYTSFLYKIQIQSSFLGSRMNSFKTEIHEHF